MEVEKWEGATTMMMTDIVQRGHSTCAALAWLGPGCHHRPPGQLRDHRGDTGDLTTNSQSKWCLIDSSNTFSDKHDVVVATIGTRELYRERLVSVVYAHNIQSSLEIWIIGTGQSRCKLVR